MPVSLSPAAPHPMARDVGKTLGLEGGLLCQLIRSPDYNLFPNSAVFESNFIQAAPLRYVQLSVHSASQRILRLQTVTKTVYYLQLHHEHPEAVFALWSRLTNILHNGLSTTTKDPAIPIHHCLVSSRSSSASSISPVAEHSETVMRSPGIIMGMGGKVPGATSQFSPRLKQNLEKPRRVSFQAQQQSLDSSSGPSSDIKVLFYDLPPPLVCARCRGRLPRTEPRRCRLDARPADSDPELAPWMDRRVHGLWQQETPTWLQPLCRLSSLAAAGWK